MAVRRFRGVRKQRPGEKVGKMKIVILDGATMNPGDIDWAPLEALGECVFYERTPVEKVLERSRGAEVLSLIYGRK